MQRRWCENRVTGPVYPVPGAEPPGRVRRPDHIAAAGGTGLQTRGLGRKSTHVTEAVYRHVIVPAMDDVFNDHDLGADDASEHGDNADDS